MANTQRMDLDVAIPADGGYGWLVCLMAFLSQGTVAGIQNSFPITFSALADNFPGSSSATLASIGSLNWAMSHLGMFFSGVLVDKFGCRKTAFLGGTFCWAGMVAGSFVPSVQYLYLTYGVMVGIGIGLVYVSSIVILGHYFKKRLGLAAGIVTLGSSVFTAVLPFGFAPALRYMGLANTFRLLGGLAFLASLCTLSFRQVLRRQAMTDDAATEQRPTLSQKLRARLTKFINIRVWRKKSFVMFCGAMFITFFTCYVPAVFLVKHSALLFPNSDAFILPTCHGAASGVGRLVFGRISDSPKLHRIHVLQFGLLLLAASSLAVPVCSIFPALVAMSCFLGLADGAIFSTVGPVFVDLVGPLDASQALGSTFLIASISLMSGMPIAGLIYDMTLSYDGAYYFAGAPLVISTACLYFVTRQHAKETEGQNEATA